MPTTAFEHTADLSNRITTMRAEGDRELCTDSGPTCESLMGLFPALEGVVVQWTFRLLFEVADSKQCAAEEHVMTVVQCAMSSI